MNFKKLGLLCASTMLFGVVSSVAFNQKPQYVVEATNAPSQTYTNHDGATYYNGISDSLTGDELLGALRSLNKNKRQHTVGYGTMGTNPSGMYKYTDYDPNTVQYDDNGEPYGTSCISFYSGNSMVSWNREHVWPNTHGGNKVEADIHMPRPTIPSENGSRGHSFFVEGMKSKQNTGWDPAMEDFGKESYRGDSARIIFYCMVATDQLVLVDDQSRSSNTKNNEMGVISDMLSWNLRYPVLEREQRRNEGAEYLQGNRNPFIDHPEYACKIWGNFNEKTKQICGGQKTIEIYTDGVKAQDVIMTPGLDKTYTLKVDGAAVSDVTWSLENQDGSSYLSDAITLTTSAGSANIHTVKEGSAYLKASYSYLDGSENKTITSRIKITVQTTPVIDSLEVKNAKTNYIVGDDFEAPTVIAHYSNNTQQEVTASFTGYNMNVAGEYTVTVSYQGITTSFDIIVNARQVKTVTSIEVTDARLGYKVGDSFQKPIVTAYYNDNSKKEVTDSCTFEGFDSSKAGDETITVKYTENNVTVQTTYQIRVKNPDTPTPAKGGCGGDVATTSIVLASVSLSLVTLILISKLVRKKKEE